MAMNMLLFMGPPLFGVGRTRSNCDNGTSVTNQKSFLALRSLAFPARSLEAAAPACFLWMAAFTDGVVPMTAVAGSRNAIALSLSGEPFPAKEKTLAPWMVVITAPLASAARWIL